MIVEASVCVCKSYSYSYSGEDKDFTLHCGGKQIGYALQVKTGMCSLSTAKLHSKTDEFAVCHAGFDAEMVLTNI